MSIKWEIEEYKHKKKSVDWFWSLWIISFAVIFLSIKFHNPLLSILVFVGAFTISLQAVRKPDLLKIELKEKGVVINKKMFYYKNLNSFFIKKEEDKILIQFKNKFIPILIIPFPNYLKKEIKSFLLDKLKKEKIEEPITHKFSKYF